MTQAIEEVGGRVGARVERKPALGKARWALAAIVVVGVALATAQGLRPKPPPPLTVSMVPVKRLDVTRTVTAAGHLQARETVKVSSNVTGDLLTLAVKEGDQVKQGQVLGEIDKRLEQSQVAQFRAGVASAAAQILQIQASIAQDQRDVERIGKMLSAELATKADLERVQTQLALDQARLVGQRQMVAQSQGQLETALYNLSRATLTAPIDGTILELYHKVGERIRGSVLSEDVVLLMGGLSDMEVKVEVGEHEVVDIHEGDEATIGIDALPDKQFSGKVVAVGKNAQVKNPGTDAEVTTFFVRVGLDKPPPSALPGLSSAVSIVTARRPQVLAVPIQAVTSRAPKRDGEADASAIPPDAGAELGEARTVTGKPKPLKVVFVAKDGKAEMRPVKIGISSRTHVEVLEGLAEGEVIVEGPYRTLARELEEGKPVTQQVDAGADDDDKDKR